MEKYIQFSLTYCNNFYKLISLDTNSTFGITNHEIDNNPAAAAAVMTLLPNIPLVWLFILFFSLNVVLCFFLWNCPHLKKKN